MVTDLSESYPQQPKPSNHRYVVLLCLMPRKSVTMPLKNPVQVERNITRV